MPAPPICRTRSRQAWPPPPRDTPDRIVALLPGMAASNAVLVAYAHSIEAEGQTHNNHNITANDLEQVLAAAQKAGVAVLGFDELPGGPTASGGTAPTIRFGS